MLKLILYPPPPKPCDLLKPRLALINMHDKKIQQQCLTVAGINITAVNLDLASKMEPFMT